MRSRVDGATLRALQISVVAAMLVSCAGHDDGPVVLVRDYGMFSESGSTNEKSRMARSELMAEPTFEEALSSCNQMLEEMGAAMSEIFPEVEWEKVNDYAQEPCGGDYVATGAVYTLRGWTARGMTLSQEQWDVATEALKPIAARFGLSEYVNMDNRKQSHYSEFHGPALASANMTAQTGFWGFGFDAGCHLPQAVKDKVLTEGNYYWTPTPNDSRTGP